MREELHPHVDRETYHFHFNYPGHTHADNETWLSGLMKSPLPNNVSPYTLPDPRNNGEKIPLVMVQWVDAISDDRWADFHDALREELAPCVTVGFLIHQTDTHITIAASTHSDLQRVGDRMTIPNTWQTKIIPLGVVDGTV